jgi:hypothetical protein
VAHRLAVGSFAASIGVVGVSRSGVQAREEWRCPSGGLGCEGATSSVLIESIPDSVRLFSEWFGNEKRNGKAEQSLAAESR